MIDTHKMVQSLQKAGFSAAQAETLTDALRETQAQGLADLVTKRDLQSLAGELQSFRAEVAQSNYVTQLDLQRELEPIRAELRLLKYVSSLTALGTGTILVKLLWG